VPTKNDILVPETVLKKRKSQEKQRELKAVELKKKRDVSFTIPSLLPL
jgi:large subunit ribosomal protein L7e